MGAQRDGLQTRYRFIIPPQTFSRRPATPGGFLLKDYVQMTRFHFLNAMIRDQKY
jgi:hypothetical protein